MSATPWFKFFPNDYLADTMGLSCCEHGVYMLLLAVSWKRGPLPDDMDHLARLAANPPIETLRFVLEQYWTRTERGWLNERLEREREEMALKHQRRVNAGRQGWQARASNAQAMLEQCSSNAQASSRSQKSEARSQITEARDQKPETKKTRAGAREVTGCVVPAGVDGQAWADFTAHRQELRKPLTDLAARKVANLLCRYSVDEQRQMVDDAIRNRWTGIFPAKGRKAAGNHMTSILNGEWDLNA